MQRVLPHERMQLRRHTVVSAAPAGFGIGVFWQMGLFPFVVTVFGVFVVLLLLLRWPGRLTFVLNRVATRCFRCCRR